MRTLRAPIGRGLSVYQTRHEHLCAALREVLVETVQAGRRSAGGIGTVPCRAVAALYMILMNHPVDRRGRCRSCRRPGVLLVLRRRRCQVHGEAGVWLHQPAEFLRTQFARELGLTVAPPATDTVSDRPSLPDPAPAADPQIDVPGSFTTRSARPLPPECSGRPSPRPFPPGVSRAGRPDSGHGGAGEPSPLPPAPP